jgi:hypothetical protein
MPLPQLVIRFLDTGTAAEGLFSEDVFCDFTSPRWRRAQHAREVRLLRP